MVVDLQTFCETKKKTTLKPFQEVQPLTPTQTILARFYTVIKGCKLNKKRTALGEPPPADEFPGLKESVDAINPPRAEPGISHSP